MNSGILPEVLSPVGAFETLEAAVRSGADAVYFGAKKFNARRNAENFDGEQLKAAVKYCKVRGVKTYLTLNIMLKESELYEALETVKFAYESGIDAVIIEDLGLARLIKEYMPDMEMHASTQMTLHSPAALKTLKEMGFSRVVAAREMTKEQLTVFCGEARKIGMQVEVFVHGALCMSVSGQCLLSAMIGGRSGNRGLCAGPCRLPFKVSGGNGYDLSLKDLSLFERIKELKEIGVDSFKIEGRMKRPEYVAAATAACRQAVDKNCVERNLYDTLSKVFSRSGFTSGYFDNKKGKEMFGVRTEDDALSSKETYAYIHGLYRNERQSIGVSMSAEFNENKPCKLTVSDGENTVTVFGDIPQKAQSKSADSDTVKASLIKLGGTPYYAHDVKLELPQGLFIPNSLINSLRRSATELLNQNRSGKDKVLEKISVTESDKPTVKNVTPKLIARFSSVDGIPDDLSGIDRIILPVECEKPKGINGNIKLTADVPRFIFDEEKLYKRLSYLKENGYVSALCGNLSATVLAKKAGLTVIGGMGLNISNSQSIKALTDFGVDAVIMSAECDMKDAVYCKSDIPKGIVSYGYIPLMLLVNCPIKNGKDCRRCDGKGYITDRLGLKFPIRCRQCEYSELLNCTPLYLADKSEDMHGLDFEVLYFTDESPEEAKRIIDGYKDGKLILNDYTRGMYYRNTK